MSSRLPTWGLLATALMIVATPQASATIVFSGNPLADGWTLAGNSLTTGNSYVGGAPGNSSSLTDFNLYKNTTTTTAQFLTDCGPPCTAWLVGDTIVGLGAVFPNVTNLSAVFLKWGVTASAYSLSTFAPTLGNGLRDFNNGDGGFGSVMATLTLPGVNGVSAPTTVVQWVGSVQNLPAPVSPLVNYAVFNSVIMGGVFQSFEGYLNVTRLNAANALQTTSLGPFVYNGNSIVGARTPIGGNAFLETNALVAGVSEPSTGLLAGGALLAAWLARRRR